MLFVFVQFLCRMVLVGASFTSFLIPLCGDQIQFCFAEGIVSCNLAWVQCALPDQPVDRACPLCGLLAHQSIAYSATTSKSSRFKYDELRVGILGAILLLLGQGFLDLTLQWVCFWGYELCCKLDRYS